MLEPIKPPHNRVTFGFNSRYPNTYFFKMRGLAGKRHNALDYGAPKGTEVIAPERMQVHEVRSKGWRTRFGYGKFIRAISLEDKKTEFIFAHLDVVPYPRVGKIWQKGQTFAWTGNSGYSTRPHLHFSAKKDGKWVNPKRLYD